jgi:acetylornithine deacetylase/succinyl-diaminopimelate desuccinylase-like protein
LFQTTEQKKLDLEIPKQKIKLMQKIILNAISKIRSYPYWSFIILLFFCFGPSSAQNSSNSPPLTENQKLALDIFRELIEINTTVNMGSTKAAEAMSVRLKNAGFPEADIDLVGPQPQHINLVVRYRGKSKFSPILFIGHLDVVDALPKDWSSDPFKFTEIDGYYYGRGTVDIKNEDTDLIANLIRLKKEGFVPDRDIIVALTEGEESGVANGIQWLIGNRRDLIDAEYCINPDGGSASFKDGKESVLGIQTSEKVYADFTFEVHNKGGHSSLPRKDNAIYHLAEALTHLATYEFPLGLNETTRLFFERRAQNETGQTRADMLSVAKIPFDTSAAGRLAKASTYYNLLMRTTCVATTVNAGHANNALPQTAKANINCRLLPDEKPENILNTLKYIVNDPQIEIKCSYAADGGPLSPIRKDLLDKVDKIATSMWPGIFVTPVMFTAATDGAYLRAAGIPVYGVSGMFGDTEVRSHGRDERIRVKGFYNGVEFMYRLMKELTTETQLAPFSRSK